MTQTPPHINESLISAAKYFNEGNLERADFICRHLIQKDTNKADALHLLALIAHRRNKLEDSIKWLKEACECRPNDFEFLTNLGNLMKANGNRNEARRYYEEAIIANPKGIVAFNNLALLFAEQGELDASISTYEKAIAIDTNAAGLYFNLSTVFRAKGDKKRALESASKALEIEPDIFEFMVQVANLYFEDKNIIQSLANFEKASQKDPKNPIAFNGIGVCQTVLGNYTLAKEALLKAISLAPNLADSQNNLASVHFVLGEFDQALICLKAALKLRPNYPEALRNVANIMAAQKEYIPAIDYYKKSLQLLPTFYEAQLELATAYKHSGEVAMAKYCFENAAKLNTKSLVPLCGSIGANLSSFYHDASEISNCRSEYIKGLDQLEKLITSGEHDAAEIEEAVLFAQPTYLSYQGLNDLEIHKRYSNLLKFVIVGKYPQWTIKKKKRDIGKGDKIRLGLVAHNFNNHVDWKILLSGIVNYFDREQFELFVYSTGGIVDEVTKVVSDKADHFYRSTDVSQICTRIEKDNIDILFFPEVGIDPISYKIASLRNAPIQCCAWGRADTSGLDTIDYFLSPQIMEAENAQSNYQEKLVLIPETGFYYESQNIADEPLQYLELQNDSIKFLCVQSLFKYMPQYDYVFSEIAKAIPNAQFIFIGRPQALAAKFLERLNKEFLRAGLDASKHILLLPAMNYPQFINLCRGADIFLDSIGYSGCLTALDVIEQNIPIVTVRGALMRSRQSAGLLEFMDLKETVAQNEKEYINTAVKLAQNKDKRESISQRMSAAKKKLFDNRKVMEWLQETFKSWLKE